MNRLSGSLLSATNLNPTMNMYKTTDYKLITADAHHFPTKVRQAIQDGWEPHGNFAIQGTMMMQPMVRREVDTNAFVQHIELAMMKITELQKKQIEAFAAGR